MTRTLYLIGVPGSGKSTALAGAAAILGVAELEVFEKPIAHAAWYSRSGEFMEVVELGRRRPAFSGTGALALNAGPEAIQLVTGLAAREGAPRWIVGEGDRLAYPGFLDACPGLRLALIDVPLDVARDRAEARARALGAKPQDESWWNGRATKVTNLCARYRDSIIRVDGAGPAAAVAGQLVAMLG